MRSFIHFLIMAAIWTALLKFLIDNGNTFVSAPLAFCVLLGVGFLVGWLSGRWSYKERLDFWKTKAEDLETTVKDLKQRIGELPKTSKYSTLTNKQLKATALNLSKDIRGLLKEQEKTTKVQRQQQELNLTIVNSPEVKAFKDRFHPTALNVRQEIQERLPDYAQTHDIKDIIFKDIVFGDAICVKYIQAIADELERLAAALPTK